MHTELVKHFTSKAYLVTYEKGFGYDRVYGVSCVCNKKSDADIKLAKLNKDSLNNTRIKYKIVEVDLDKGAELFQFNY